jgi:hypothetical protein
MYSNLFSPNGVTPFKAAESAIKVTNPDPMQHPAYQSGLQGASSLAHFPTVLRGGAPAGSTTAESDEEEESQPRTRLPRIYFLYC